VFGIASFGLSTALLGSVKTPWQLFAVYLIMSFGWATMSVGAITNILACGSSAGAASPSRSRSPAPAVEASSSFRRWSFSSANVGSPRR